jgi:ribonuclease VapC
MPSSASPRGASRLPHFLKREWSFAEASPAKCKSSFEELIASLRISIVPVTEQQAHAALDAFSIYGKGQGHPAGLNCGDCFSYALAKVANEPLLYKGRDFSETDIPSAL